MKQTDAAEVEAVANLLSDQPSGIDRLTARLVLASDWLAAREAAAEVRGAQAVLAAVEGVYFAPPPAGEHTPDACDALKVAVESIIASRVPSTTEGED